MAKLKFVSEKGPKDHAQRLFKLQAEISKRRAALNILETEAEQLKRYLQKINRGKSFEFDGPLYRQVVRISHIDRLILDQEMCKKLLKSRTPYKPSPITKVEVDYVYEKD
jgi:hypothetical protein